MNLKNINNLFFLIVLFLFVISCSKIDSINKKNSKFEIIENINIEKLDIIEDTKFNLNNDFLDFYNRNNNFEWKESIKLNKILSPLFFN